MLAAYNIYLLFVILVQFICAILAAHAHTHTHKSLLDIPTQDLYRILFMT